MKRILLVPSGIFYIVLSEIYLSASGEFPDTY